jgi:rod shape-determining protein MreD
VALVLASGACASRCASAWVAAFVLGLLMDVAYGSVMGQHALAYVLLAYFAGGCRAASCGSRSLQQALHVLPMLLGTQLVMLLVRAGGRRRLPRRAYFLGSFIGDAAVAPDHLPAAAAAVPAGGQG